MKNAIRALALGTLFTFTSTVQAAYGSLWAFGDSLTDSGNIAAFGVFEPFPYTNLVPGGAYASGTFSDGQVWSQKLAGMLGLPLSPSLTGGTNYATGGAKTGFLPSIGFTALGAGDVFPVYDAVADPFIGQANLAASLGALPGDGLYMLNGGGNDIRAALEFVGGGGSVTQAVAAMSESVANLSNAVGVLAAAGALHFGVSNLPDISVVPSVQAADALVPGTAALAHALVQEFNAKLAAALPDVVAANPGINIAVLDAFTLFNDVLADPLAHGFTNTTDACTLQNGGSGCANPDEFVFWDGLHPTSAMQQITADAAYAALVPLPAAAWLLVPGMLVLARRSRRVA
ncbi:MAG: SGNH/GDSL hydrolase family protein [Gammaproteobacteria bacterium]